MVMLAEHYDFVIGGDPDRDTIDLAILNAGTGRVRDQIADRTDGPAYPVCRRGPVNMLPGAAPGFGGHQQLRCRLRHDASAVAIESSTAAPRARIVTASAGE